MDTLFPGQSPFFVLFCFAGQSERRSVPLWLHLVLLMPRVLDICHHLITFWLISGSPETLEMRRLPESEKQAHRRAGLKWALADAEESRHPS